MALHADPEVYKKHDGESQRLIYEVTSLNPDWDKICKLSDQ